MPAEPVRVQLSLPHDAWAVLVDGKGAAVDLCSPEDKLSRCVLSGAGGAVFLWSPAEPRVQTEVRRGGGGEAGRGPARPLRGHLPRARPAVAVLRRVGRVRAS